MLYHRSVVVIVNMPQCSVPYCNKMGGHVFPSGKLRKLWQIAIKRADRNKKGTLWEPGPAAVVCRDHFSDNDYFRTTVHGKPD